MNSPYFGKTTTPVGPMPLQETCSKEEEHNCCCCSLRSIFSNQPNSQVFVHFSCRKRYSQTEANDKENTILLQHKRVRERIKVRVNVHSMYMWKA